MIWKSMQKHLTAGIVGMCCAMSQAYASDTGQPDVMNVDGTQDFNILETYPLYSYSAGNGPAGLDLTLAQVDTAATDKAPGAELAESNDGSLEDKYEYRMFTASKIHKYLGIGSVAAALLVLISPKEEDGPHEYLAKTSAVLGLGAVVTGFTAHYEDISWSGGFKDPDNLHALFAGLGAVAITAAAATGPDDPHVAEGIVGLTGMLIGVKLQW